MPVAKFSPLIQIASTAPPLVRPACFSPRTLLTASAVSVIRTCLRVTPNLARRRATSSLTKPFSLSSPPYMYQLTVCPFASVMTWDQSLTEIWVGDDPAPPLQAPSVSAAAEARAAAERRRSGVIRTVVLRGFTS